jgi:predicted RNA binding protein YcfA (HicA-like mRNA interferase family)
MRRLLEALGFRLARVSASHHIFTHPGMRELVNLQEVDGKCKPYQLKQVLKLIDRNNLRLGDETARAEGKPIPVPRYRPEIYRVS